MLKKIIEGGPFVEETIRNALNEIHANGPVNPETFEKLAYIKKFHGDLLGKYEGTLIKIMGLFFKTDQPSNLFETVYSIYSDSIYKETGRFFTPVQASAYKQICERRYFSFSAPTSAGKSYLFRELIKDAKGDIVIVVPSRALIAEYFKEVINLVDNTVLVLQFIEDVNKANVCRRIYIITPERSLDLFKYHKVFKIEMFLLDEAQISDEPIRGMKFDSLVRRADRVFPEAKKIFAHPFINNPEAQLIKHGLSTKDGFSINYNLHTVGKIFLSHNNGVFHYFSPYSDSNRVSAGEDIASEVVRSHGTMLVYISKNKIYDGSFIVDFAKYIGLCPKVTDATALAIIEKLRHYIGAQSGSSEKRSTFIEMMTNGIVVHHGSMPLKARLLIEDFIRCNCARICFATSTLNQGINMPFDVVWIDNFTRMEPLTIKNLIGRSGRSTLTRSFFDYGFTIVKHSNTKTFSSRMLASINISDSSSLDNDLGKVPEDLRDIVEAVKDNTFNDELNLPQSQVDRVSSANIDLEIKTILDNLMVGGVPISGKAYYDIGGTRRTKIKASFGAVYTSHLRRSNLTTGEKSVLSAAIPIMLWRIQGKSFSEIVSLRHAYLSNKDDRRSILNSAKKGEITASEAKSRIDNIPIEFSPVASPLPNQELLRPVPLFRSGSTYKDIDFDTIVYDTYDYLDKVISLSLTDPICAALEVYWVTKKDKRARALVNFLRFGTNDDLEIWLLRYGFDAEDLEWLKQHIKSIDENKITFKHTIHSEPEDRKQIVSRYL